MTIEVQQSQSNNWICLVFCHNTLIAKSKWMSLALIILALSVVLGACSGAPVTGSSTNNSPSSQSQQIGSRHKLFVFLSGFTSQLSTADAAGNGGYGSDPDFFGTGRIQPFLQVRTFYGVYDLISAWRTLNYCNGANFIHQPVVKELNDLFNSATLPGFRGATASIDTTITLLNQNINQTIALDAMQNGVAVSTFGNTNDMMWQPDLCTASIVQNFSSTQWLREVQAGRNSHGGAIYARSFTAGSLNCKTIFNNADPANHVAVLTDPNVQTAIWQVMTGGAPDALNSVPGRPDFSRFVGLWKYYGTVMTINADGKAILIGRTHIFCSDDPRPPCDGGDVVLAGSGESLQAVSEAGGRT